MADGTIDVGLTWSDDEDVHEPRTALVWMTGPDVCALEIPGVANGDSLTVCFDPRKLQALARPAFQAVS